MIEFLLRTRHVDSRMTAKYRETPVLAEAVLQHVGTSNLIQSVRHFKALASSTMVLLLLLLCFYTHSIGNNNGTGRFTPV